MKKSKEKKKRGKLIDWKQTAHREKLSIVVLSLVIVFLTLYIGYDIYDSFETKDETGYLNSAVVSLTNQKSSLLSEIELLNSTITNLTPEKTELIEDNFYLEADLNELQEDYDALQEDYDALETDLTACEEDLDDCEASCP